VVEPRGVCGRVGGVFALAMLPFGVVGAAPAAAGQDPGAAPERQTAQVFPVEVERVVVDVVVTDEEGTSVADLTRADFTVEEDGKPQEIAEFELVEVGEGTSIVAPDVSSITTNASVPVSAGRSFVVVFDDLHLSPQSAKRAKEVLDQYLRSFFRQGDRVTVAPTAGGAWWTVTMPSGADSLLSYLGHLVGRRIPDRSPLRMSDYEALRIHLGRDNDVEEQVSRRFDQTVLNRMDDGSGEGRSFGLVQARAAEVYADTAALTRATLDVLSRALGSLTGVRGFKSVILVSDGFVYDRSLREYKEVGEASRRSRTAIYFLDSQGLTGTRTTVGADAAGPLSMVSNATQQAEMRDLGLALGSGAMEIAGSHLLAVDSGGFRVGGTNNMAEAMWRIVRESRAYYLIGYQPTNTKRDGEFRKIEVKVARAGLKVRARQGYYAPSEGGETKVSPGRMDPRVRKALDAPHERDEIPLRVTSYVMEPTGEEEVMVLLAAEADPAAIDFLPQGGRLAATLDSLVQVSAQASGQSAARPRRIDLDLSPPMRDLVVRTWIPFSASFRLPAGAYQALVLIKDSRSERIGTVRHEFEVPDLVAFRTSTPVLTDTFQPAADKSLRPVSLARRRFASGTQLACLFDVYGAAPDQLTGLPEVSLGYRVGRTVGSPDSTWKPKPVAPGPEGSVSQRIDISLRGAEPGDYELVLLVRDEVSGNSLELREPFVVEAAKPASIPQAGTQPQEKPTRP